MAILNRTGINRLIADGDIIDPIVDLLPAQPIVQTVTPTTNATDTAPINQSFTAPVDEPVSQADLLNIVRNVNQLPPETATAPNVSGTYDVMAPIAAPIVPTAPVASTADNTSNLRNQILQQWGQYGDWNASDVDRAQELAEMMQRAGITDIGDMGYAKGQTYTLSHPGELRGGETEYWVDPYTEEYTPYYMTFGGKQYGFLGDYNNNNTISSQPGAYQGMAGLLPEGTEAWAPELQGYTGAGWSARGHGNVTYNVGRDPNTGKFFLSPTWGSSSDMGDVREAGKALLGMVAAATGNPYLLATNAAVQAGSGNPLGAIISIAGIGAQTAGAEGLAGAASTGAGNTGTFLGASQGTWQTIGTAAKVIDAIKNKDIGSLLNLAAGSDISKEAFATQIGSTGYTLSDAVNAANTLNYIDKGEYEKALTGLGQLTGSKDVKFVTEVVKTTKALEQALNTGNFSGLSNAVNAMRSTMSDPSRSDQAQNLTGGPSLPSNIANVPGPVEPLELTGKVSNDFINELPDSLPTLTEQDLRQIVSQVKSEIPPGVDQATVDSAISLAIQSLPESATPSQVAEAISSATQGFATRASVADATNSMTQALDDARKDDASKFASIEQQIASMKAAGLSEADIQDAIDSAVSASNTTLSDQFKGAISDAISGNESAISTLRGDVNTQIGDVKTMLFNSLGSHAADVNAKIEDLVSQGNTYQDATRQALSDIGLTIEDLGADFTTKIGDISTELGGVKTGLEQKIGGVEAQVSALSQETKDALAQQSETTQQRFDSLTADQQKMADQLVQQGQSFTDAIDSVEADVIAKIEQYSTKTAEDIAGLSKDMQNALSVQSETTQKRFDDLTVEQQKQADALIQQGQSFNDALDQGQSFNDALDQVESGVISKIEEYSAKTAEQIAGISKDTQNALAVQSETTQKRFDDLTADQQKMADQLIQQGQSFNDAIDSVEADVISKIEEYSAKTAEQIAGISKDTQNALAVQSETTQKRFDDLTADQQKMADALIQQGQSFNEAIDSVEAGVISKIEEYSSQTEQKIAELSAKTKEAFDQQSEDTKQQILDLDAAQRQKFDELIQNDVDINEALTTAQEQTRQEIADLSEAVRNQYGVFSQEQQDLIKQMTDQGTSLEDAINQVSTDIQRQVSEQNTATQAQFSSLTKSQQDEVAARVQQGADIKTAINNVISAFTSQTQATQKQSEAAQRQAAADSYLANLQTQAAIKKAAQSKDEKMPELANVFYGKGAVEFGPGAGSMASVADFQGQKAQAGDAVELALAGKGGENGANDAYTRLMALASQDPSATVDKLIATVDELMRIIGRG